MRSLSVSIPGIQIKQGDHTINFPGGGEVRVRSADNPDSLRGEGLDFVVLDECAYMKEETWSEVLRPSLSDRIGKALFISTPKGMGWFYSLWNRGASGEEDWFSWKLPTSANPFIKASEIEAARRELPEIIFRQEYEAQFVDSEGAVFRRVQDVAILQPLDAPIDGHQYVAGVDVAASVDYTVVCVMDAATREMVYMDRFNRVDYTALEERLAAIYSRWRLSSMKVEANSIGQPVIDHLYNRGLAIIPFTTTQATKQSAIQSLQAAFEHDSIRILDNPVLIGELLSFESKRNQSGSFSYSAPDGMHDDTVMALAICWTGISGERWFIS
jgi:phage terminase large subunit-like protein